MNTFSTILLILIFILIVSDVFFLWKIYRNIGKKKKELPDEKYFELKYNINLLKAVSAILIFLIGFLGFTTYNELVDSVENDLTYKLDKQNIKIDSLSRMLLTYEKVVESLELRKNETVDNLIDINREFKLINNKLTQNQLALKYTPQIFVVRNLEYDEKVEDSKDEKTYRGLRYYYSDLKTIYNEDLPKFKIAPLLNIQGNNSEFLITKNTSDFFELLVTMTNSDLSQPNVTKYKFDIWLVPLD